jgi:hypothetical protein
MFLRSINILSEDVKYRILNEEMMLAKNEITQEQFNKTKESLMSTYKARVNNLLLMYK